MVFVSLFDALLILTVFLSVVVVANKNLRRRSLVIPSIFAGLLLTLIVGAKCAWQSDIEWNPSIPGDRVVIGTWKNSVQTIVLKPDHTFIYRTPSQTFGGTWARDDWNLRLRSDQSPILMRFVKFHARYRVMTEPPGDPDAWDGGAGLEQMQD